MADEHDGIVKTMERLVAVAQPGTVFGEPTASGDHTVIMASEVSVAMGLGFGLGGGGGGVASGRPVAVISVGPDGVQVRPVVDPTKIALAALTTLGAMLMMLGRMRSASRS